MCALFSDVFFFSSLKGAAICWNALLQIHLNQMCIMKLLMSCLLNYYKDPENVQGTIALVSCLATAVKALLPIQTLSRR